MEVAVTKKTKVEAKDGEDYSIKPTAVTPSIDTSSWPLLLKNYDKREYALDSIPNGGAYCTSSVESRDKSTANWRQDGRGNHSKHEGPRLTLLSLSPCSHRSLHPDPQWQLPVEARPQVVYLLRCH